jgi:hypothetical protein
MGNFLRSAAVVIIIVSTVVLQVLLTRHFPCLLSIFHWSPSCTSRWQREPVVDHPVGDSGGLLARQLVTRAFGTQRLYENRNRVPGIHDEHNYRR